MPWERMTRMRKYQLASAYKMPFNSVVILLIGSHTLLMDFFLFFPFGNCLCASQGVQGVWSFGLAVCVALAKSRLFEIMSALVAEMVSPELGSAYLGTQSDEFDAQKDMACALAGAVLRMALVFAFSKNKPQSVYPS